MSNILEALEQYGYYFRLSLNYEFSGETTPRHRELLDRLKADKDAAIRALAGRLWSDEGFMLGDYELPPKWEFDRPITDALSILTAALKSGSALTRSQTAQLLDIITLIDLKVNDPDTARQVSPAYSKSHAPKPTSK